MITPLTFFKFYSYYEELIYWGISVFGKVITMHKKPAVTSILYGNLR
jgi:hypothetical protein